MASVFRIFLVSSVLGMTGCASNESAVRNEQLTEEQIVRTDPNKSDRICKYKRVTGSQIPQMQCFTRAEIEQNEEAAKETMRNANRRGGGSPKDN
jgi:hypothetical protein